MWCRLLKQLEYMPVQRVKLRLLDSADGGATPFPRWVLMQSLPLGTLGTQAEQAAVGVWMNHGHAEVAERFLGVPGSALLLLRARASSRCLPLPAPPAFSAASFAPGASVGAEWRHCRLNHLM